MASCAASKGLEVPFLAAPEAVAAFEGVGQIASCHRSAVTYAFSKTAIQRGPNARRCSQELVCLGCCYFLPVLCIHLIYEPGQIQARQPVLGINIGQDRLEFID